MQCHRGVCVRVCSPAEGEALDFFSGGSCCVFSSSSSLREGKEVSTHARSCVTHRGLLEPGLSLGLPSATSGPGGGFCSTGGRGRGFFLLGGFPSPRLSDLVSDLLSSDVLLLRSSPAPPMALPDDLARQYKQR